MPSQSDLPLTKQDYPKRYASTVVRDCTGIVADADTELSLVRLHLEGGYELDISLTQHSVDKLREILHHMQGTKAP